jgi:protein phosphatase
MIAGFEAMHLHVVTRRLMPLQSGCRRGALDRRDVITARRDDRARERVPAHARRRRRVAPHVQSAGLAMADDPNAHWRDLVSRPLDVDAFHPRSAAITLDVCASSVCGTLRTHNTDHYLVIRLGRTQETLLSSLRPGDLPPRFEEHAYALLVADGLGDRGSGARASRVALSALAHLAVRFGKWNVRVDADSMATITEQGEFLYRKVHDAVLDASRADEELAGMATSLTALYIAGLDLFYVHVGHSKAFLFRDGQLVQLTTDHTLERQRGNSRSPTPNQHLKQDFVHVVTDSLGGPADLRLNIEHITLTSGDRLLLCTNGLTDAVTRNEIAGVLALQRQPADDCQRLIELAEHAADDVTVVVAECRLRQ